tara:strand:+ start:21960 stop:22139 length:180 start_codon:yes stop_codon:yes gene_type:complete
MKDITIVDKKNFKSRASLAQKCAQLSYEEKLMLSKTSRPATDYDLEIDSTRYGSLVLKS